MRENKRNSKDASRASQIAKIKSDRKHILTSQSGFFQREAYKALRTNVNFALADTDGCKVILVTSAMRSEGKSLTALNLAISLAQTEQKVLIIDCDLRRPKLNRLLNMSAISGLSNLLMDAKQMDVTILTHENMGIDTIFCGDIPPNPSELLASVRMQKLLKTLRERYDYIIVDSPPVNMVIDAVVLAPQCDGVLFVVKADQSERGAVTYAVEQLEYAKAKVMGFVFNGVTEETGGFGKYRYGRYGYGRYGRYSYSRYGYGRYGYGRYDRYGYSKYGYGYGHQPKQDAPEKQETEPIGI